MAAQEFKYLAVKNWDKFQPRNKSNFQWIRDYIDKDSDSDYASLTMLQRYVLDGCCRLRARFSKNICNDAVWVSRALCVMPVERRFVGCAIAVLVLKGFLVLCNEQNTPLEERRGEERRGDIEQKNTSDRVPEKEPEETEPIPIDELVDKVLGELKIPSSNPILVTAIGEAIEAKGSEENWTQEKAAIHMVERGLAYKSSAAWNTTFKKGWPNWFKDQCYDQDPKAWEEKKPPEEKVKPSQYISAEDLIKEKREKRRLNEEPKTDRTQ